MKLEAIGISEKGQFRIVNSAMFRGECEKLPTGHYRITIEKKRNKKSNAQLAWLYGQIYPHVLRGLIDVGYDEFTNLDQIDAKCKEMFARQEIINKHTGEVMSIPALKRNMTTTDMMAFVDSIRNYCSEYLGTYIPGPGEQTTII